MPAVGVVATNSMASASPGKIVVEVPDQLSRLGRIDGDGAAVGEDQPLWWIRSSALGRHRPSGGRRVVPSPSRRSGA